MKITAASFKMSLAYTASLNAPNPVAGHCQPTPPPETPGHSRASLSQSLVGSLIFSPGSWCTQGFGHVLQESFCPVLCKFWRLYGEVNGHLLQEGLCHTQVYCTQSPCPCSSPLWSVPLQQTIKHSSVCLCGVSGSLWLKTGFVWALRACLVDMGFYF